MSPFTPYKKPTNSDAGCTDFMTMAEYELSAFFNAVTHLFGSEQAKRSAEDWLQELSEIDALPSSTREWRRITVNALNRLPSRVTPVALTTESQPV